MRPKTDPVKDIVIDRKMSANEILSELKASGGFTANKLAVGTDIVEKMLKDKECLRFLSFPACIIATGTRGVVKDTVRRKMLDIVMTTCGSLDHDIARSYEDYHHGEFLMDDRELRDKEVNRLGNVLVPNESYGIVIEKKMLEFLKVIYENMTEEQKKNGISTHELIWKIGELLDKDKKAKKKSSIVYWCWKNKIPMIVPGPTDGSVGYQIWQFAQDHDLKLDLLADEKLLSDKIWEANKTGALIVGGGISKHHVIWWNQFKGDGLDYAVYISTAVEWDGSLSGARPREAISWGKIGKDAKFVNIEEDATIALPLMYAALNERL